MIKKNNLQNLTCVILAGGYGTRFSEETIDKPKPLIELGNMPIITHIIKLYSFYGLKNFIICGGYKINKIKEYFLSFSYLNNDIEVNLKKEKIELLSKNNLDLNIKIIDTGLNTMTGGRIKRIKKYLSKEENFFLTYGDGVGDINISKLFQCHLKSKKIATLTAVKPVGRFGSLVINKNNSVKSFSEKKIRNNSFINGGFFVLSNKVFKYLRSDNEIFENYPLSKLAERNELNSYKHDGFWHCMDNLRDHQYLNSLWNAGKAPWKIW